MTRFEVLLSETARRQLSAMPPEAQDRIKEKLRDLTNGPYRSGPKLDIKRLKGPKRDYFRLRIGPFRAIYSIDGDRILVTKILLRSKAYDWID